MTQKISTKLPDDSFINRIIQPGMRSVKINSVMLEKFPFKVGGYHIILNVEGPDLGPKWNGFYIDREKPELGKYKGQSGRVKANEWAFTDGETKGGVTVSRDREILKFMQNMCMQLGLMDWFQEQDDKFEKIEDLVAQFNNDGLFKDKWVRMCICGKEYAGKGDYVNYDLYLPRFTVKSSPFELETVPEAESKVPAFDPIFHMKKKKTETIESFGGNDEHIDKPKDSNSEFDL